MAARKRKHDINLLSERNVEKNFQEQLLSWAMTYGRYIIIVTQITVLTVFFARFKFDREYADLQEKVQQKQAIVASFGDLEAEVRRIQQKLGNIATITEKQHFPESILKFFQENVPKDTKFTSISFDGQGIAINVTLSSMRSFNVLLTQLQKEGWFSEIMVEDINRRSDGRIVVQIRAIVNSSKVTKHKPS